MDTKQDHTGFNGDLEDNVRALLWTVFGDQRNPDSSMVARVTRIEKTLSGIYRTVIGIFATGLVALVVNVIVLVAK